MAKTSDTKHEQLDGEHRLFVDMDEVDRRDNVRRTYHPARKHGPPVIEQQAAWEKNGGMTASVIYDQQESVFKCWYMAGFYAPGNEHVQCLALSDDGIAWRRPELGLHEALGSTANNIVIPADYHDGQDHFESMLKDPLVDGGPAQYKAIGWSSYDWDGPLSGIYTGTSPDGVRWEFTPEPVFHYHPRPDTDDLGPVGDAQAMMIDTRRRRYVALLRGAGADGNWRVMSESQDFVHWTPPRRFMHPLHEQESLYNNVGFVYGAQYLGFLTHFDRRPDTQSQTLQLLSSRDGDAWARPPASSPLVPLSDIGDWDRFQIMLTGAPPILVGDRLHIYYRGTARRHNKVVGEFEPRIDADQERKTMSIGLATIRADGFASIDGSYDGGTIITRPYDVSAAGAEAELHINVKSDYGQVSATLLDEQLKELAGYTQAQCAPVTTDSVDAVLRWRDAAPLGQLRQPVRIRFHLHNARLYSFWAA